MNQKPYPEFKQLDLAGIASDILMKWDAEKTFEQSIVLREGVKTFTFYEGPPSANGLPGIHHVMARAIKDIFCRFKTLQGYQVKRKGGWDTHGLPIELSVEKTLGITKEDIGKKISVEDYNKACRKEVMKYKEVWDDLTRKMGYWVDLENPYITFENGYIETCWYLLKELYKKNLLYKGYTIQPYSPAAGTGLSSHELNQPGTYKMVKDTTVVAQFRIKKETLPQSLQKDFRNINCDFYFLAWTTTPWTLPSNSALAVGEKISYVWVQTFNQYTNKPIVVVLAKVLFPKYFSEKNAALSLDDFKPGDKQIPFKIITECKGSALAGIAYEQLLPYVKPDGKAFVAVAGDFVSTEDGTGIVHLAPTFGADDFRTAKQQGISAILVTDELGNPSPLVDKRGRFVKEVTDFAGEFVKEEYLSAEEKEQERQKQNREKYLSVDERIAIKLKQENKAFKVEKYEHNYPHCWRTDKPVLYYPLDSWFIRTTACKERMIALNKTINWKPESTGTGRFGNWLENLVDWNLSRSRYWGIPLPIWRSEDEKEEKCIGSVNELRLEIEKSVAAGFMDALHLEHVDASKSDFDLHRPYVDNIVLVSDNGQKMYRETDLIDVWFDSGAMPYAQWQLDNDKLNRGVAMPFKQGFENSYPADFIAEGVDQTRGWFFTLHAIAVMLFDSVAFKNVVSNGLVLDKNGNKMSKRLGNAADPFETINKFGPDATRWYMISNAQPWDNLKFNVDGIAEVQRKFFGTLYNTYSFFALYANIDGFIPEEKKTIPLTERPELDRWILSKLHHLIKVVIAGFEDYEPTYAARQIETFVDEHLSNWYVRLSRRRFWRSEMNADKAAAYQTLFECLKVTAQLMSPIAPFFSDWLYRNLTDYCRNNTHSSKSLYKVKSIHLTHLVQANESYLDSGLEERMDFAQRISSMVLALRKKVNVRVRQPLQKILIPVDSPQQQKVIEQVEKLILSEVNVKEMEFVTDASGLLVKKIKANFKVLGKKLGALMKDAAAVIAQMTQDDIRSLESKGTFDLRINENVVAISVEDVEISSEDIPGWQVNSNGSLTVALDISISPQLRDEGIARELVNRIQNLRKDKGFEVTDKIQVKLKYQPSIITAIESNLDYICAEILASSFTWVETLAAAAADEIEVEEGVKTIIEIERI
ncbi:MAG TPA: isoleucine--tRNA ligase [Bacteroidia bacterium]|nr:isoleucine--tRNA ligase [Bacteroidia bacterium]HMU19271.1 isoleucine--tRNA ligase [Bacteroidia bacterium]